MALELLPGEMRGYWKYHAPSKWFKQAKTGGKINNEKADMLLDSGAEVSILDAAFARVYVTKGRTKIKVTLAGSLVYVFNVWVGEMTSQNAILGMDFMVPAAIRLDLADGTLSLPDEIRIQLSGRRPLYDEHVSAVRLEELEVIELARRSRYRCDLNRRRSCGSHAGNTGSLRLVKGAGWRRHLQLTNISDRTRCLPAHTQVGMWLSGDRVPRRQGFVTVGSRRYAEWQNLVLQATTDAVSEEEALIVEPAGPMVDHPQYDPPKIILKRPAAVSNQFAKVYDRREDENTAEEMPEGDETEGPTKTRPIENAQEPPTASQHLEEDQVCISEGGEIFAKDVDSQMAVLTEITMTTEDVKLEDIRIENDGNALPPAARGVVCDIDTGDAKPVAQRVRRVAPQFRDKLSDLIKGLLSAKIIRVSSSPWASPIVVIIKKNGVDIRLCIDYRVVNSLTRLMVYPMPLVNDLLEDLDKVLWYCSLDMTSGFWALEMTERARMVSVFITPFGLFEWLRMPFGLKNAPQVYQRLLDNALYGYLRIPEDSDQSGAVDVFQVGEPDLDSESPVLGRRSYIDDILICVVKSSWEYRKVDYLGHRVSADGLEAHPKNLETLTTLPLPGTLGAMQSFLGSLNYYSRFIEDLAIYALILYELREIAFHEMSRNPGQKTGDEGQMGPSAGTFEILKNKIAMAPVLRHFDPDRVPVVVVYARDWAISATLVQEHDGTYMTVPFTSRTLKPNELNYGLQGRLGNWAALLCPWTLEIVKCTRGEDEILGTIAASITPRESVDSILSSIAPRKQPRQQTPAVIPTVEPDEELLVVSFDGSARVKRGGGACSAIVWKLPEWIVVAAESKYLPDLTVSEAEYQGPLLGFDLLSSLDRGRLIICGDSNLVVSQMRGEIECKAPGLTPLRRRALDRLRAWPAHEFLHVKRDWNQSADRLANTALHKQEGTVVTSETDHDDLVVLNRLQELLLPKDEGSVARMVATTRSRTRSKNAAEVLQLDVVQSMRADRILRAQNEEKWIVNLKAYLSGDLENLDAGEARACSKLADEYDVDDGGLLLYCPRAGRDDGDRDRLAKLVVPEDLQQDVLHHYHTSLEGGHQGVGRTYQRVRTHFHWRGLFKSVQRYVGQCADCETGKGRPTLRGESPGNIQATYPFPSIAMDHIPSLPKSHKGNTELLIWVDLFSGYVIAKASASRTAQAIAESYEECVFRRFGASEAIRHDREPGFMSDFFRAFNRIVGQRQRATMAYRPQANGTAERMDWDEYAERLTFALNTAHDRIRGETSFYLVHGWDARSTLEATLPLGSTRRRDVEPRRWRFSVQRQYQQARKLVNEALHDAIEGRAEQYNEDVSSHDIKAGDQVWLYLDRVKKGYARKLAHMWHGQGFISTGDTE
ncbi:hypothetical protein F443_03141 [Phytophthora nicotianae P1569]|uniref:Uncharacterized protein n=1 Tax=Phytophthora nicotianae P1569 TaxID=1317065 RepID=V9FRB6_PHYNI|nr:hypothetical protein F443_03141 [Phytophthora nicotianae P1569]